MSRAAGRPVVQAWTDGKNASDQGRTCRHGQMLARQQGRQCSGRTTGRMNCEAVQRQNGENVMCAVDVQGTGKMVVVKRNHRREVAACPATTGKVVSGNSGLGVVGRQAVHAVCGVVGGMLSTGVCVCVRTTG